MWVAPKFVRGKKITLLHRKQKVKVTNFWYDISPIKRKKSRNNNNKKKTTITTMITSQKVSWISFGREFNKE